MRNEVSGLRGGVDKIQNGEDKDSVIRTIDHVKEKLLEDIRTRMSSIIVIQNPLQKNIEDIEKLCKEIKDLQDNLEIKELRSLRDLVDRLELWTKKTEMRKAKSKTIATVSSVRRRLSEKKAAGIENVRSRIFMVITNKQLSDESAVHSLCQDIEALDTKVWQV